MTLVQKPPAEVALPAEPATEPPPARRSATALLAVLPFLVALGVGWTGASERQMWNNEYATWHAATLSWRGLAHLLSNTDLVHTVYILLIKGWITVAGDSPLAMRMPSLAATALAAGFLALLGRRLVNTPVGVVAGLLFAGVPAVSRYAQEARSYALVTMMVVLSSLLLARALEKPVRLRWVLYGTSLVLAGLLHFASLVVLAAHLALVAATTNSEDSRRYRWAGTVGVAGLGVIPLLSFASKQSASISWIEADLNAVRVFPRELFLSWTAAAVVAGLGLIGVAVLWRRHRPVALAVAAWAVLPIAFVYVTYPILHMFLARYVLYTLPAWALLASAAVCGIGDALLRRHRSWHWLLGAVLVVPAFGYAVVPDHRAVRASPVTGQPDYRGAIDLMRARMRPGDGLAYNDVFGTLSDLAREAVDYEMRDDARPRDVFLAVTSVDRGSYSARECGPPSGVACTVDAKRIWLISTAYSPDPLGGLPPEKLALLRPYQASVQGTFQGVKLVLLTRP